MSSLESMERELHAALGRWADDHSRRYPEISALPYDPATYPAQRIDVSVTRTKFEAEPDKDAPNLDTILSQGYESILGIDAGHIRELLEPAAGELRTLLRRGGNAVFLAAHAERLQDIGVFCGGLAVAFGEVDLIRRNGTMLNKVMSREFFAGGPMDRLFELFGNVYWVIPETESTARWDIPDEASTYINLHALRAVLADMRRGVVLTIAPSGSAMRPTVDADGRLTKLSIPRISSGTANLISRFDAYVIGGLWKGEIAVGSLTPIPSSADRRRDPKAARSSTILDIVDQMAELVSNIAGVPVDYDDSPDG